MVLGKDVQAPAFVSNYVTRDALRRNSKYFSKPEFDLTKFNVVEKDEDFCELLGKEKTFSWYNAGTKSIFSVKDEGDLFSPCAEKNVAYYVFSLTRDGKEYASVQINVLCDEAAAQIAVVDFDKFRERGAELNNVIWGNIVYTIFGAGTAYYIYRQYNEKDSIVDVISWILFYHFCRSCYPVGFSSDLVNMFCGVLLPPLYIQSIKSMTALEKKEIATFFPSAAVLLSPFFYYSLRKNYARRTSIFFNLFFIFHYSVTALLYKNNKKN